MDIGLENLYLDTGALRLTFNWTALRVLYSRKWFRVVENCYLECVQSQKRTLCPSKHWFWQKECLKRKTHTRKSRLGEHGPFSWQLTGLFDHQQNQRWHLKKKAFPWKRFSGKNRVRFRNPRKSQVFTSNHQLLARGRQCWMIRTLLSCLGV